MTPPRRPIDESEILSTLDALWAMDHGLQAVSRSMQARLGVTGPQRFVLRVVGRRPGLTAGELARTLHDHPSTLTAMLKRLVAQGLVQREGDPADQRRVRLRLTSAGADIDRLHDGTAEAAVLAALALIPPQDADTFRRVMGLLAQQLDLTARSGSEPARSPGEPAPSAGEPVSSSG